MIGCKQVFIFLIILTAATKLSLAKPVFKFPAETDKIENRPKIESRSEFPDESAGGVTEETINQLENEYKAGSANKSNDAENNPQETQIAVEDNELARRFVYGQYGGKRKVDSEGEIGHNKRFVYGAGKRFVYGGKRTTDNQGEKEDNKRFVYGGKRFVYGRKRFVYGGKKTTDNEGENENNKRFVYGGKRFVYGRKRFVYGGKKTTDNEGENENNKRFVYGGKRFVYGRKRFVYGGKKTTDNEGENENNKRFVYGGKRFVYGGKRTTNSEDVEDSEKRFVYGGKRFVYGGKRAANTEEKEDVDNKRFVYGGKRFVYGGKREETTEDEPSNYWERRRENYEDTEDDAQVELLKELREYFSKRQHDKRNSATTSRKEETWDVQRVSEDINESVAQESDGTES
ncbi:cylicin-2 [Nematostella vectensis]|uniref:cylicin-2 n=1 Tax=Nematostella vectensis TaxID=45351 RepID=UPI0020772FED|nr:cylicin-2 [Nematostella vectensis]